METMSTGYMLGLCLAFFGTTFLIKDSTLLGSIRRFVRKVNFIDRLLDCSFCTGTWVGIAYGIYACAYKGIGEGSFISTFETIVFFAMVSASSSYLIDTLAQLLEVRIHVASNESED